MSRTRTGVSLVVMGLAMAALPVGRAVAAQPTEQPAGGSPSSVVHVQHATRPTGAPTTARGGRIRIPALNPAVPLVLTSATGRRTVHRTRKASVIRVAAGGYRLTARRPVRGQTAVVPNDGYLVVHTGRTTRVRVRTAPMTATLNVRFTHVPDSTRPSVAVTGPNGYRRIVRRSTTLRGLPAGTFRLKANSVALPGGGVALGAISRTELTVHAAGHAKATVDYRNHTTIPTWTDYSSRSIAVRVPDTVTAPGTWDGTLWIDAAQLGRKAKVGDAVILRPSELLPLGYVGVIDTIGAGQVTARSVPLPRLIPDLAVSIHLSPEQVARYSTVTTQRDGRSIETINECTAGFPPLEWPSITATPTYEDSDVSSVAALATWDLKLPLTPAAEAGCQLGLEGRSAIPGFGVEIPGGIAGLYAYWSITMFAEVTLTSASVTIPLTQPIPLRSGFLWDRDSGGSTVSEPGDAGPGPDLVPPHVELSAGIRGEIGIRAGEELNYEVAGLTLHESRNYLSASGILTPASYLELPSEDDATGQTCFARFYAKLDIRAVIKAVSKNTWFGWDINDDEQPLLDATLYTTDDLLEHHLWCWTPDPNPASPDTSAPPGPGPESTFYAFKSSDGGITQLGITGDRMWGVFAMPESEFAWFTAQRVNGVWQCSIEWDDRPRPCMYVTFTGDAADLSMTVSYATTAKVAGPVVGVDALDAILRQWDSTHPFWKDQMYEFKPLMEQGIRAGWDNGCSQTC